MVARTRTVMTDPLLSVVMPVYNERHTIEEMIGRVLADEFFQNRDWPVASAVAVALLAVLVIPIMIYNFFQAREAQRGAS